MEKAKLSLIIAIVNSGFAEAVMDVAKKEGVRGGTITHCRGTSNESMAKMVWIRFKEKRRRRARPKYGWYKKSRRIIKIYGKYRAKTGLKNN